MERKALILDYRTGSRTYCIWEKESEQTPFGRVITEIKTSDIYYLLLPLLGHLKGNRNTAYVLHYSEIAARIYPAPEKNLLENIIQIHNKVVEERVWSHLEKQ